MEIANYEEAKKKLQVQICDLEMNKNILQDVVYTMHGDFAAYYTMVFVQNAFGNGSITVNNLMCQLTPT
ncbi:MAG: DUF5688 family protein [Eubacteriales bacterium]|nr:DUF5688 family protein [Eubacteriales bacterium]